jgi:hypothetical protein
MQPVEHFQALVLRHAVERATPRLEDLDMALRAVGSALARAFEPIGPRRVDAPDEHETGVGRGRRIDRDLAVAYFIISHHSASVSRLKRS